MRENRRIGGIEMAKYVGKYTETYERHFIIEADSQEEASEKLDCAAENIESLVDIDHFDHWDTNILRPAKEIDLVQYDMLPEE